MTAAVPLCRRAVLPWRESLLGLAERLERPDPAQPGRRRPGARGAHRWGWSAVQPRSRRPDGRRGVVDRRRPRARPGRLPRRGRVLAPARPSARALHNICMSGRIFCMGSSPERGEDGRMDVLSIVLGVVMFAVLFALIYGIDAI